MFSMNKKQAGITLIITGLMSSIISLIIVYSSYPERNQLDLFISDYLLNNRTTFLAEVFFYITNIGEFLSYVFILLSLYYIWNKKKGFRAMFVLFFSTFINTSLKYAFNLPRPDSTRHYRVNATDPGLPSGHTQLPTTLFGTLITMIKRRWINLALVLLIALVSFSRIYLQVHWFTDVLMGLGLGLIILGLYVLFEEPVTNYMKKMKIQYQFLIIIGLFSIFIVIFTLLIDNHETFINNIKYLTLFATATLSYSVEEHFVNYDTKTDKWWKYILRFVIAMLTFSTIYFGLKILFGTIIVHVPWLEITLDILRYALLGPTIILLAPWLIKRMKL